MPRPSSRDAILDTAVQIASVQGLEGLSIGGLAKAAGKSKGGICAHFPAKADLQLAVVERAAEIFRRSVVEPALEKRSGFERLEALMEGWFAYIQSEVFRGGCFFTNAALELDDLESTEVLEQVQHLYGAYLQLLEKNIARAAERVFEPVVWSPAEVVELFLDVALGALPVDDRDAFADPDFVELLGFVGPDLEVVRPHKALGDAVAEDVVDELTEVGCAGSTGRVGLRIDQTIDAGFRVCFWQIPQVVLEGVRHPGVHHPHPALTLVERVVALHELLEDPVVFFVMAKENVAADVPGEAVDVGVTPCQPADCVGGLAEEVVCPPELAQPIPSAQPSRAGADDEYLDRG